LQKQLGLKFDEFNIMRCYGWLLNAEMSDAAKYPMLLPRCENYVNLVIQEVHERLIYAGVSHTLSSLCQEYWIPQGRRATRACISSCLICRCHEGPGFSLPMMPPWPKLREYHNRYLSVYRVGSPGSCIYQGWIGNRQDVDMFVHMPCCTGNTFGVGKKFISWTFSLRKFMAWRGRLELIISDNAAIGKVCCKWTVKTA